LTGNQDLLPIIQWSPLPNTLLLLLLRLLLLLLLKILLQTKKGQKIHLIDNGHVLVILGMNDAHRWMVLLMLMRRVILLPLVLLSGIARRILHYGRPSSVYLGLF
jgi:hypothetical protein